MLSLFVSLCFSAPQVPSTQNLDAAGRSFQSSVQNSPGTVVDAQKAQFAQQQAWTQQQQAADAAAHSAGTTATTALPTNTTTTSTSGNSTGTSNSTTTGGKTGSSASSNSIPFVVLYTLLQ